MSTIIEFINGLSVDAIVLVGSAIIGLAIAVAPTEDILDD